MGKWYWYTYEVGVLNESREKLCNCDGDGNLKVFRKRGVDGHRKLLCGGKGCVSYWDGAYRRIRSSMCRECCWGLGSEVGI